MTRRSEQLSLYSYSMIDRLKNFTGAAAVIVWQCAAVWNVNATTVVPPTFEELVDRADLVFVGKVVDLSASWRTVGTGRVIFTRVQFQAQEVLKGHAEPIVTLQFLGGTAGDATLNVPDVPKFRSGDRVIL